MRAMLLSITMFAGLINMALPLYADLPYDDPYEVMLREQERVGKESRAQRQKFLFPEGERFLPEDEKNTIISLRWFAAAGDLESQATLADLYAKGISSPQDLKTAYYWYSLSAKYGNTYSQLMAGIFQQLGYLGKPDAEEAAKWFLMARDQEDKPRAMRRVAQFFDDHLNPLYDETQAYRWYEQAAYAGDVESQITLGDWYEEGDKVTRNLMTALKWYGKAAAQNSAYAQYSLGVIYLQENPEVPLDYAQAMKWLEKSAWQGFHAAQYLLGKMYYMGNGVPTNQVLAYAWWKMSNRFENPMVTSDLARITQKMSADEIQQATKLYEYYLGQIG
ncbi:MAG: tetratricopeptide repeat protein [Gammaproteobacteria bacterium]